MADKDVAKTEKTAAAPAEKTVQKKPRAKKRVIRSVPLGHAYISASYNNTIMTVTDPQGNVLAWSSAGRMGFRGPKKATPYAASVIVRDIADRVREFGLRDVHVFVKGIGSGRESAVRALNANSINVLSIKDVTPLPHSGCRPPRPRRV